jgi:hypothetical protein
MDVFRTRYGVREFSFIEGDVPGTGSIKVAFAWAGGQVLELIFATGPGYAFYNEILPENEFAIRFHHLGFIIHDEEGWWQLEREIAEGRWEVVYSTLTGDFIDAYYLRAPELGHFIEYVRPFEAGNTFYNQVPQS